MVDENDAVVDFLGKNRNLTVDTNLTGFAVLVKRIKHYLVRLEQNHGTYLSTEFLAYILVEENQSQGGDALP